MHDNASNEGATRTTIMLPFMKKQNKFSPCRQMDLKPQQKRLQRGELQYIKPLLTPTWVMLKLAVREQLQQPL
jgi:hypothetical protein